MIFFSDMDGTLLTSDKRITPETWAALDAIHDAGMQFVPCTARAFNGVPAELLAHPSVRYVVASNGASVVDLQTQAQIHAVHLTRQHVLDIYQVARGYRDITFDIFSNGACYSERARYDRLAEFAGELSTLESLQSNRTPYDEPCEKFIAEHDDFERCGADVEAYFSVIHACLLNSLTTVSAAKICKILKYYLGAKFLM